MFALDLGVNDKHIRKINIADKNNFLIIMDRIYYFKKLKIIK